MAREQKIALVTGANKGIGFEVARQLARKGFHVFLAARNEKAGQTAAEKLRKEFEQDHGENKGHGAITILKIDVSKPDSIQRAAEQRWRSAR
jgi:NAD(P)-dependent dehydrogenase (short-subunit alcohol dehydrogenase family)